MNEAFLDTSVLVRHLTGDDPVRSPRATRYLARVEAGEVRAYVTDAVILETGFVLERSYDMPKASVRDQILAVLSLPGLIHPDKGAVARALDLYARLNISLGDSLHVAAAERLGLGTVVSFDRDFNRVPGLRRVEPD